jgi:glutathione S-transferase
MIMLATMVAKLYVLPGSHPCAVAEAALKLKDIDYERVDLLPMTQRAIGPLRYGGSTVPGLRINGERLVGSRAILRRLDAIVPDPALYPAELERRKPVLEAEAWGDETLQSIPRRIADALFLHKPHAMESYAGDAKLPLPLWLMRPTTPLVARVLAIANHASDERVQADLVALPGHLDRIDDWITEGLLGGSQPNAADLQIGSSVRLLESFGDVAPLIAGRAAARLSRYFPPLAGGVEAGVLPPDWIPAPAGSVAASPPDSPPESAPDSAPPDSPPESAPAPAAPDSPPESAPASAPTE